MFAIKMSVDNFVAGCCSHGILANMVMSFKIAVLFRRKFTFYDSGMDSKILCGLFAGTMSLK